MRTDTEFSVNEPLSIWALSSAESIEELRTRLPTATASEISAQDPDVGDSALHYSATRNNVEIARLLIEFGAPLNLSNNYGRTPLHLAALYNSTEVANILIDAGAEVNIKDIWGESALSTATVYDESISAVLVDRGAALPQDRRELNTILDIAVMSGNKGAVRKLVTAGAEVWRKNALGHTPFALARVYNHEDIANLLLELGKLSDPAQKETGVESTSTVFSEDTEISTLSPEFVSSTDDSGKNFDSTDGSLKEDVQEMKSTTVKPSVIVKSSPAVHWLNIIFPHSWVLWILIAVLGILAATLSAS
jgi:ankyrin repeat protein